MAGLQYNFFPTDCFYPRPAQPSTPAVESSPTISNSKPQIQKRETADRDDGSKQPGTLVRRRNNKSTVSMRRKQGEKLGRIYIRNRGDQVKLPRNSVSWLILIPDEEEQSDSS
ncbi:hypothetical protein F3Y22_tig00110307pilonHSYRG00063 [Hibiscus syriacus]|uniref:Uncharacterized protein n=1 Tax=Hibiscus syriacus TaxID=106335 RepID=A0A6A3B6V0_HIBSY|nr:hypothetical protein F3Y22_tig00110307pilonHSYRG00063 [Hibiscus syriacus]